jgi:sugar fermentation stimulation protein A
MGQIPWLDGWKIKRPEVQYEESRVDFEIESDSGKRGFIEVKSAAMLLDHKIGSFPDCPTTRGQKHVGTMQKIAGKKMRSIILFLVQHPDAKSFTPNADGDPVFAKLLQDAVKKGVEVHAVKMYLQSNGNVVLVDADLPCMI